MIVPFRTPGATLQVGQERGAVLPRMVPELGLETGPEPALSPVIAVATPAPAGPARGSEPALRTLVAACVVIGVSTFIGASVTERHASLLHNKMLPWILGRSLGVACYVTLTALVLTGLWIRHPWRTRFHSPTPGALLRAHVVLAAATVTLLGGHLTAIALDHYAGVGWMGAFVPWQASYRSTAVALGTLGLYGMVLIAGTAALAGLVGGRVWLPIHATSAVVFGLVSAHAILAGSDTHGLRWMYVLAGASVVVLQASGWLYRHGPLREEAHLE